MMHRVMIAANPDGRTDSGSKYKKSPCMNTGTTRRSRGFWEE